MYPAPALYPVPALCTLLPPAGTRQFQLMEKVLDSLAQACDQRHNPFVVVELAHGGVLLVRPGREIVIGDQLVSYLLVVLLQNLP